jgi:long-chain acyl-CoA synthetase
VDEDGFVTITDRKKEIIVTAGGKKIAPQNLENALKTSPVVSQALVVGDRRPYVAALVSIDRDEAGKLTTDEDALRALVEKAVASVNERLGRAEQIKRFAILSRDFSMEAGEVTPTLKLKRRVCEQHFQEEIEALYA